MLSKTIRLGMIGLSLFFLMPGKGHSQECFASLDYNGDGFLEITDLSVLMGRFALLTDSTPDAYKLDLNGDCVIDQDDFDVLIFCSVISPFSCGAGSFSVCCDPVINYPPPCCVGNTGNVDNDPDDITDIADLTALIDHLFINFPPLACREEGNVDGDSAGLIDIADLTALIDHLFINFPPTAVCQ